jgi:membrane protein required for colicin V production
MGRGLRMGSFDLANLQSHWVDLAMFGWLLVSMVIGLVRGVVFETFSLLGWGVAYFAAQWTWPLLAPYLPLGGPRSEPNHVAAFLCVFVAVLLVWSVASRLARMLVRATPLGLPDRVFGAGFGVLRGVLVLLVGAAVIGLTPMAQSLAWKHSEFAPWLNAALHELKPLLPDEISKHVPA